MHDRKSSPSRHAPARTARVAIALAALLAPGCASWRPTQSGFLGDYSQLRKDPIHLNYGLGVQRALSHDASAEAIGQIDSYYIEPVRWLVPGSRRIDRDPSRAPAFCSTLDQALREELGRLKPIVDVPGPRTARVRSAITLVHLNRPVLNALLTATVATPVFIGPMFVGSGVVEVEAIGPDGRQLAAVSTASTGGMLDVVGFYTRSGHVKKAMKRAAHEMEETLERR